jgi:hypothetical protein
MSRTILTFLAFTLFFVPSWSQEKKPEVKKPTVEVLSGYLRVQVILDNESVFHGLADKKRMVEEVKRYKYVTLKDDQQSEFGAGIRLWFYDDLAGFLFFRYRLIDKVVVEREISLLELNELKVLANERAVAKQVAVAKSQAKLTSAKKAGAANSTLDANSRKLLTEWPPHSGWTEEKFADIQKRAITDSYELSAEEAAWTKVYPDWLKALRLSQVPVKETSTKKAPKSNAKLIVKPKVTGKPKSGISSGSTGRIKANIKRPERQEQDNSSAERGIR